MKKNSIIIISLVCLNSLDILYQVSFKLGLPAGFVYIPLVSILIVLLYSLFRKYTYKNFYTFLLLMVYFFLQMINGWVNNAPPEYSVVVFISFALIVYLMQMFSKFRIDELFTLLRSIFYITIVVYIFIDISSILIMGKSQHVILTNIAPFLLLTAITISISEQQNKASVLPFKYLLAYILWLYVSIVYFTTDMRFQVKALAIITVIAMLFILVSSVGKVFPRMKSMLSLKVSVPFIMMIAFGIFSVILFFLLKHLYGSPLEGREVSLGLRISVASLMVQDLFEGNYFDVLFGYGLGSSMQLFPANIGTQTLFLRSHSGLLSLFYEHGLFAIVLLSIMVIKFIKAPFLKDSMVSSNKKHYKTYNILILVSTCMVWFFLNTVYLIAVNVPNYVHQSQIVSTLLLAVFLNRVIFAKKINNFRLAY